MKMKFSVRIPGVEQDANVDFELEANVEELKILCEEEKELIKMAMPSIKQFISSRIK